MPAAVMRCAVTDPIGSTALAPGDVAGAADGGLRGGGVYLGHEFNGNTFHPTLLALNEHSGGRDA